MSGEYEKSGGFDEREPHSPDAGGYAQDNHAPTGFFKKIMYDFQRDPRQNVTPAGAVTATGKVFDAEAAAQATANSPLQRKLKGRHLQMIAIGGSIGTGLFVGSGTVLARGGPASLLIAYSIIGGMLYFTVQALGELAVLYPVAGSFSAYSTRFIDPAWGFAMGWNYAMQWLVVLPLEIVAATLTINYWTHGDINNDAWVALFLATVVIINLFGVRGYGEAEFVFALIKVVAIIGFIILGIVIDVGGAPKGGYLGGKYWHDPGAFNNGFKGVCSVFVSAAFAFAGTELVGLAAAETANPRKSLPTAAKQVFWRICLFYIVSLTIVGLLVAYDNPLLLDGKSGADATASPFVIAIKDAGISGLPSVMNVVIMIAVLSVGNSSVYGSSRTLAALAEQRMAPRIFAYIDRQGRPLVSIGLALVLGLIAFIAGAGQDAQNQAFNWMLALSGLSSIFTWGSICFAHIRFRKAWRVQGRTLDELPFRTATGIWGSWIGFIINVLVLIAQFWTGFAPVGYASMSSSALVTSFFEAYLAAPIIFVFFVVYKFYWKTQVCRTATMDIVTGQRELNLAELMAEDRAERATWPKWKKVYKFFC